VVGWGRQPAVAAQLAVVERHVDEVFVTGSAPAAADSDMLVGVQLGQVQPIGEDVHDTADRGADELDGVDDHRLGIRT
jgi:hypothetical protein